MNSTSERDSYLSFTPGARGHQVTMQCRYSSCHFWHRGNPWNMTSQDIGQALPTTRETSCTKQASNASSKGHTSQWWGSLRVHQRHTAGMISCYWIQRNAEIKRVEWFLHHRQQVCCLQADRIAEGWDLTLNTYSASNIQALLVLIDYHNQSWI